MEKTIFEVFPICLPFFKFLNQQFEKKHFLISKKLVTVIKIKIPTKLKIKIRNWKGERFKHLLLSVEDILIQKQLFTGFTTRFYQICIIIIIIQSYVP